MHQQYIAQVMRVIRRSGGEQLDKVEAQLNELKLYVRREGDAKAIIHFEDGFEVAQLGIDIMGGFVNSIRSV